MPDDYAELKAVTALTDAARAEAERRWPNTSTADPRPGEWLDEGMASGFVLGALWAREQSKSGDSR